MGAWHNRFYHLFLEPAAQDELFPTQQNLALPAPGRRILASCMEASDYFTLTAAQIKLREKNANQAESA
jgi:hypothetical protein